MLVTPLPIVTLVRPVHQLNALLQMLITLSPIVTLVRPVHQLNALSPISVTVRPLRVSGMVTSPPEPR